MAGDIARGRAKNIKRSVSFNRSQVSHKATTKAFQTWAELSWAKSESHSDMYDMYVSYVPTYVNTKAYTHFHLESPCKSTEIAPNSVWPHTL